MILGIDPKVDFAFKRVFGDQRNDEILIHLVNAILRLSDPIVSIEILNPFNDKDFADDKLTILDVKARDQAGRILHVEVQIQLPKFFHARILYYWAGNYHRQLREGAPFTHLRPTFTICLLNQKMFPQVEDYHLTFGLHHLEHRLCFSDHLQIHVLELPKFTRSLHELRDEQDKWMYFFLHAENMDTDALPEPFREPIYQRTAKELLMLTKDEILRERYEARQMAIRDLISQLEEAREDGLEKGLEKGLEQGALIERVRFAQQILDQSVTPEEQLQTLSIVQLRELAQQLKSAVLSR
jgi:predicted transposase/invertase (TIGR01784 family)